MKPNRHHAEGHCPRLQTRKFRSRWDAALAIRLTRQICATYESTSGI